MPCGCVLMMFESCQFREPSVTCKIIVTVLKLVCFSDHILLRGPREETRRCGIIGKTCVLTEIGLDLAQGTINRKKHDLRLICPEGCSISAEWPQLPSGK